MIVFTHTDFPDPVAPAISRCGIFARSAITGLPFEILAERDRQRRARVLELGRLEQLAERNDLR